MPMTVKPASANSTARGSPTYPNPTTPTRARLVRIFSARTCAVARGKVPVIDSAMKPPVSHSARGRAEKHGPAGHELWQVIRPVREMHHSVERAHDHDFVQAGIAALGLIDAEGDGVNGFRRKDDAFRAAGGGQGVHHDYTAIFEGQGAAEHFFHGVGPVVEIDLRDGSGIIPGKRAPRHPDLRRWQ